MGISNSTVIVAALLLGFVMYVTAKGALPTYLGLFGL